MKNLTQERANVITSFLESDQGRAEKLFGLGAEEALEAINGGTGQNFTLDEIKAYGAALSTAVAGSMGDADLEAVAGGAGGGDMEEDSIIIGTVVVVGAAKKSGLGAAAAGAAVGAVVSNVINRFWP